LSYRVQTAKAVGESSSASIYHPLKQGVNKRPRSEIALAWNGHAGTIDCNSTDI
jgi:hypothetical protein